MSLLSRFKALKHASSTIGIEISTSMTDDENITCWASTDETDENSIILQNIAQEKCYEWNRDAYYMSQQMTVLDD